MILLISASWVVRIIGVSYKWMVLIIFIAMFKIIFSIILAMGMIFPFLVSSGVLSQRNVEFCQMLFLHLLRWSHDFNLWFYLQVALHLWFVYVKPSLHLWNQTNLVTVYDFFLSCCWIGSQIFVEVVAFMFIEDIGL
jgi:hypothetical protein